MKIGLLTYHHSFNYGAVMQSYATVKALQSLGHNVEFINIRQDEHRSLKHLVFLPKFILFDGFVKRFYPPETNLIKSYEDLCKEVTDYDILMVGSDQTWNPDISGDLCLAYFLKFGNPNMKRVSYASSFGFKEWPERHSDLLPKVEDALKSFDSISVREKTGQNMLKVTFGLESEVVLDPTMLHSNYDEIVGDIKPNNEICCYLLNRTKEQLSFARELGKELGKKPTIISNVYPFKGFHYVYPPSIEGWLRHIGGSEVVVTDSFHGVVFSLLYHRKFVVVTPDTGKLSRLIDLLKMVGLKDHFFLNADEALKSKIWEQNIDYGKVDAILDVQREKSWTYLTNCLSE